MRLKTILNVSTYKTDNQPITARIDLKQPLNHVSDKYLSFSIDTSKALGGNWWSPSGKIEFGRGKKKTAPLDFSNSKLIKLASELTPAYMRLGGTQADNVIFDNEIQQKDALTLSKQTWDNINSFVKKTGVSLFLTANAGPLVRNIKQEWQNNNLEKLLQYSKIQGYELDAVELGNELNAYWFFHGFHNRITPGQYLKDFKVFQKTVKKYYRSAKTGGAAAIFWPVIGEAPSFTGAISTSLVKSLTANAEMFTWHYYPQQSQRFPVAFSKAKPGLLLNPMYLKDMSLWACKISQLINKYNPEIDAWISETGNALCGGQPGISDTFEGSLWWADTLGQMAANGQKVIVRQDLIGANYGLLDENTLDPLPDYWISLLWKKLMGEKVYKVQLSNNNPFIRIYAHQTKKDINQKAVTIVCINLQNKTNKVVFPTIKLQKSVTYTLSAKKLSSKTVLLNNKTLKLYKNNLPKLNGITTNYIEGTVNLNPYSISFFVIPYNQ